MAKGKEIYKRIREQEMDDIRFLMDSVQGRRFLWRILEKGNIFGPSYTPNGGNIFFNDGMKNVACFVLQEIMEECGDQFIIMMNEDKEAQGNLQPKEEG